ncbi:MAG: hypothetical protein E7260_06270 [Lachnospiraceae bacterium]|nr:hypothetical protein [Lachnospiraceae bacterium]
MMNQFYYNELQLHAKNFETLSPEEKEHNCSLFINAVDILLQLHRIAFKEGLLQLEEVAMHFGDDVPYHQYLSDMIIAVIDGNEPKLVEDFALLRYSAKGLRGVEGWVFLIYLLGTLQIQAGENEMRTEQKLLAMMPKEAEELYQKREEEKAAEKAAKDPDMLFIASLFDGELAVGPEHEHYLLIKTCNSAIISLESKTLRALLREGNISDSTLATAMKGFSGQARKQILTTFFHSYSSLDAVLLARQYMNMEPVSFSEIAEATQTIFSKLLNLMREGKIVIPYDEDPERYSWLDLVRK